MYFCYDILSKQLDTSSDMESPLPDEEMDTEGDCEDEEEKGISTIKFLQSKTICQRDRKL